MSDSDKTTVLKDNTAAKIELDKVKQGEASLIVIRGEPQGKRYLLTDELMALGRDPAVPLAINDSNVSRRHAEIIKRDGKVFLKDLGSTNGSFINDKKVVGEAELHKEDMIKMGNTILKYLPQGELETYYIGTLEMAAHTDALTKAFNKGYIMEALEAEFKRAKALHTDFSLIIFDLDHFKKINDGFGHDAGDMVLREVANLVRTKILPERAVFGRFGGEEFMILLPGHAEQSAADIAEKLRSTLEKTAFTYEGKRLPVASSLGVAEISVDIENAQSLFKRADKAVYQAKNGGRNQVCVGH